ncbi:MAG: chemotaxis protein CheB, partial [Nannocystaceae bacterium]
VYVAPGAANLEVVRCDDGRVRTRVQVPGPPVMGETAKITPSGDALFRSVASVYGSRMCAVILTGMGSDGREGSVYAAQHGASVLAENPASAVMPGMPQSVVDAGAADEVLSIEALPDAIARFAARLRAPVDSK